MLSVLFWNVHNRPLGPLIAAGAADTGADLVILTECDYPDMILPLLNVNTLRSFSFRKSFDGRFVLFSRLPAGSIDELGASQGLTFFQLSPPIGMDFLLVAAHLPSKLIYSDEDQRFFSRMSIITILDYEQRVGHDRTVLVGDFNMNPFESGMINVDGFHSTSSRSVASRVTRTVHGQEFKFFYNPMWNLLGDDEAPPGSYYHTSPSPTGTHWHLLDQVMVRPSVLGALPQGHVRILTRVGGYDLLRADGRIDTTVGSDHLPLWFELNFLEEE